MRSNEVGREKGVHFSEVGRDRETCQGKESRTGRLRKGDGRREVRQAGAEISTGEVAKKGHSFR